MVFSCFNNIMYTRFEDFITFLCAFLCIFKPFLRLRTNGKCASRHPFFLQRIDVLWEIPLTQIKPKKNLCVTCETLLATLGRLSTLCIAFIGKNSGGLAVHYTFDEIQKLIITDSSTLGIHGKLVGQFAQNQFSPKCQKGIQLGEGLGHIELDGNKLDSEKKDAMSISLWIRVIDNDRINTIYGSLGAKGMHHLSIKSTGSPNAVVHWVYKSPDGKVVFDLNTKPAVPAGQQSV